MAKYLTLAGLNTFWAGVKTKLEGKVDKVDGYGLSKNDLTDELKAQYDAAYQYATTTDAEKNVIVAVKVNGVALEVDENRAVDVTVPTKTSDITNDSDFATNAGVASSYYNKDEVDEKVEDLEEAIGAAAAGKITTMVVDAIDKEAKTYTVNGETKAAEANVIYLVPKDPAQANNAKDEWMLIGGEFEKIGDTEIDLSSYLKKEDVVAITDEEIAAVLAS